MGDVLEPSFDGGPLYPTVNTVGKYVLGCRGVRWPDSQLSTCTHCHQAGEWSAVTVQECLFLSLSVLADIKKKLSESLLRCLMSVRIPDVSRV